MSWNYAIGDKSKKFPQNEKGELIVANNLDLDFWPRGKVLFEDEFENGLDGWDWLMSGKMPRTGPVWTARRTQRGTGGMLLSTGDAQDGTKFGGSMAIKRLILPRYDNGKYAKVGAEYLFSYESNSQEHPRAIDFGFDTQLRDSTRHWYKLRWQIFNETTKQETSQLTGKWQVQDGDGEFKDIPGAGDYLGWNQAKGNTYHIKFVVDLEAMKYVSFWINGDFYDLSRYTAPPFTETPQADFDNGFNYTVQIFNHYNIWNGPRWCKLTIPYVRGTVE